MSQFEFLRAAVRGEVLEDTEAREKGSTDASIFKVIPDAVFVPADANDLAAAVRAVAAAAKEGTKVSLTARAAGTCMSGGSLTTSIQVDCRKLDRIEYQGGDTVSTGPGTYYRDLEKALAPAGYLFPSYPASKMICAMGGIIANNAGGERSLSYGKADRYVRSLDVILDDGSRATLRKLDEKELETKLSLQNREGEVYRAMHELVMKEQEAIQGARPRVSKNSSGYALWDVWDPKARTFDLTQVVTGSQGTLCLMTDATLGLVHPHPYSRLVVIFLKDESRIATLVHDLLAYKPEALECYDRLTMRLALKYLPSLARHMGLGLLSTFVRFVPDYLEAFFRGTPPLAVLVQLTGDHQRDVEERTKKLAAEVRSKGIRCLVTGSDAEAAKYWAIRRESFALLRERMKTRTAAPFVDDLTVRPEDLSEYMPQLERMLARYSGFMAYSIAGHVGDGDFHIFPLIDLKDPEARHAMYRLFDEAVALTLAFGGSTSGEHNDGLIRTRFVERQFGTAMTRLFEKTKDIWDPQGIFNPGKKVRGDWDFAQSHVK